MKLEIIDKKTPYKKINAPFGYFGSKNKIALQICDNLPPHNCWVETFCGSAALTLSKPPTQIEIINDIDNEIVNFFDQLRNNQQELCKIVALTPYARQELINSRVHDASDSKLERARKFLVASMMAINGVFGKEQGGFSYSQSYARNGKEARVNRWYNLPERLEKVAERLKNVRVENKDAREIIKMFQKRPATLLYIDPPYFAARTNGYKNDETVDFDFQIELLELANNSKSMIFISGYENDFYNQLLLKKDGWAKRKIQTHTKDSQGKTHERTEVVWMNKHFQRAVSENKVPIRLSLKERKQNKINPERR